MQENKIAVGKHQNKVTDDVTGNIFDLSGFFHDTLWVCTVGGKTVCAANRIWEVASLQPCVADPETWRTRCFPVGIVPSWNLDEAYQPKRALNKCQTGAPAEPPAAGCNIRFIAVL